MIIENVECNTLKLPRSLRINQQPARYSSSSHDQNYDWEDVANNQPSLRNPYDMTVEFDSVDMNDVPLQYRKFLRPKRPRRMVNRLKQRRKKNRNKNNSMSVSSSDNMINQTTNSKDSNRGRRIRARFTRTVKQSKQQQSPSSSSPVIEFENEAHHATSCVFE